MPLLMAFMPIILIPLIEIVFFRHDLLREAVLGRGDKMPLFAEVDDETLFRRRGCMRSGYQHQPARPSRYRSVPDQRRSLWAGLVVCGLLTTAAIYVRRYREKSTLCPRSGLAADIELRLQLAAELVIAQSEQIGRHRWLKRALSSAARRSSISVSRRRRRSVGSNGARRSRACRLSRRAAAAQGERRVERVERDLCMIGSSGSPNGTRIARSHS